MKLESFYIINCNFRVCVKQCGETGCVAQRCFPQCNFSSDGVSIDGPWYMQEPLYMQWKQWDCQSDCRYYCMLDRENEREATGHDPVKYHGKWPFKRVYGIQVCFFGRLYALATFSFTKALMLSWFVLISLTYYPFI